MVIYNFKKIAVVPTGKDFIDIVLSSTQRKTPTIIHKHFPIGRIRGFYMRKIKYTQQTFHDKLTTILEEFPILDNLHPFYGELLNILYDKDHYKLALGQLHTVRRAIDNIANDYVKLLKYGDSLYRCKQLKRAALGRMCTLIKQQTPSLNYLEQVRQHLARLPAIDPHARTILLTGYPNVGKSSLMNKLTRANVDVQPYAFTTKSLFVGHMDYKYLRWQVLDTPGILDHSLEARNTIEMQAITSLAHLRCAVLFLLDITGQCGYTIQQQVSLFNSIKPLFVNKPLFIVLNKVDILRVPDLDPDDQKLLEQFSQDNIDCLEMSTLTEEGIVNVKTKICNKLLTERVERKMVAGKVATNLHRIHLATPKPRDNKARPAFIPQGVLEKRREKESQMDTEEKESLTPKKPIPKITKVQLELEHEKKLAERYAAGELGWSEYMKEREKYVLDNEEWKLDIIPEIFNGTNIADYIDTEILEKLEELEDIEERERLEDENFLQEHKADELTNEQIKTIKDYREKKGQAQIESRLRRTQRIPANWIGTEDTDVDNTHLQELGIGSERGSTRIARKRARSKSAAARRRSHEPEIGEEKEQSFKRQRTTSLSRVPPRNELGLKDAQQKLKAQKLQRDAYKQIARFGRAGEADRHTTASLQRHLNSGKRGLGKTDWR